MLRLTSITLLLATFLSGCASMNKSECLTADWRTVGFEDGVAGENISNIGEYRKDCAKHGVSPSLEDYQQGHAQGSELFCTTQNGFERGNDGRGYQRSCPEVLEQDFLTGYQDGQELYGLRQIMRSAQHDIERTVRRINRIDEIAAEKSELMIADGLVRDERAQLREEIDQLRYEQDELHLQIPELRDIAKTAERNYAKAERRLSHYFN